MAYYVYIIQSELDGTFYKGSTFDYKKRFADHNAGRSKYTSSKVPWLLIYVEEHPDKISALIRESKLKRCKVVNQSTNILNMLPNHGLLFLEVNPLNK